jgi:hypothetical protein
MSLSASMLVFSIAVTATYQTILKFSNLVMHLCFSQMKRSTLPNNIVQNDETTIGQAHDKMHVYHLAHLMTVVTLTMPPLTREVMKAIIYMLQRPT